MASESDDALVSTFEMLVEEIGTFDRKVMQALTCLTSMKVQQKGYIANSVAQTKALLGHFSTRKGVIAGCIAGLPFDVEKGFSGEASCALVGSLFVRDPDATNRLLNAVVRASDLHQTDTFGRFTEAMYACFSPCQVASMHSVFLDLKRRSRDDMEDECLGSDLTCKMVQVEDGCYEHLGMELVYRFAEHKYMCATSKLLGGEDETVDILRGFKSAYSHTWKNAWFVPVQTWVARDVFCCLRVFITSERPLTVLEFAKFVEFMAVSIMNVPPELMFRLRVYSMGETCSACPETSELACIRSSQVSVKRICGLLAKAMVIHDDNLNVQELVKAADVWYSDMVLVDDDVLEDIRMFNNQVRSRLKPMLERKIQTVLGGFLVRKFNILTDGMYLMRPSSVDDDDDDDDNVSSSSSSSEYTTDDDSSSSGSSSSSGNNNNNSE